MTSIPDSIRRFFSSVTVADFPQARSLWQRIVPDKFAKLLDGAGFKWNAERQSWRDAAGVAVNANQLASDLVNGVQQEMRAMASQAKVKVHRWFHMAASKVKGERIALGALAAGGFKRMTQSVVKAVTGKVDEPGPGLAYTVDRLANVVETAEELSEAQIGQRSELAASAGWGTYAQVRHQTAIAAGMTQEYNRLDDDSHHCSTTETTVGCPELTAMQWQPIGSMPLPGSFLRTCKTGCRCSMAYQ